MPTNGEKMYRYVYCKNVTSKKPFSWLVVVLLCCVSIEKNNFGQCRHFADAMQVAAASEPSTLINEKVQNEGSILLRRRETSRQRSQERRRKPNFSTENQNNVTRSTPLRNRRNAKPVAPPSYSIKLDLIGMPTTDRKKFKGAAKRWSAIVNGDLPDIKSSSITAKPGIGCKYPKIIDDVYICARYEAIDGVGLILGSAGPTIIRTKGGLTVAGQMKFDSADMAAMRASGTLRSVVLHEIGHILGIGTLWQTQSITGSPSTNCPYNGANANREYESLTGCTRIPMELDGKAGTRCRHFDDGCMNSELMTGFINSRGDNPLSKMTIGSLQDLGYKSVNYAKADTYKISDVNNKCICNRRLLQQEQQQLKVNSTSNINTDVFVVPLQSHGGISNGTSNVQSRHRKLSEEGLRIAVKYGRSMLKQAKDEFDKLNADNSKNNKGNEVDVKFVGADVVSVLFKEGEDIFGVIVTSKD